MKENKVNEIIYEYTFQRVSNTDYFENPQICCEVQKIVDVNVDDYDCGIHKRVYVNVVEYEHGIHKYVDRNGAISVVAIKLLMLVLQNMSVASTRILLLLLLTMNMVSVRVSISILVLLKTVSVSPLLLVNMPAIMWGEVLKLSFIVTVVFL